jgi:hypothetical protein
MKKHLTDVFVRSVEPPVKGRLEITDLRCTGLTLRVTKGGVKSCSFRFRDPRSRRLTRGRSARIRLSLCKWPAIAHWSLAERSPAASIPLRRNAKTEGKRRLEPSKRWRPDIRRSTRADINISHRPRTHHPGRRGAQSRSPSKRRGAERIDDQGQRNMEGGPEEVRLRAARSGPVLPCANLTDYDCDRR